MSRIDFTKVVPTGVEAFTKDVNSGVTELLDREAKRRGYDSASVLASYVSSGVPGWAAEAKAFTEWRDKVWLATFAESERVVSNGPPTPSDVASLIEGLPDIEWP